MKKLYSEKKQFELRKKSMNTYVVLEGMVELFQVR